MGLLLIIINWVLLLLPLFLPLSFAVLIYFFHYYYCCCYHHHHVLIDQHEGHHGALLLMPDVNVVQAASDCRVGPLLLR